MGWQGSRRCSGIEVLPKEPGALRVLGPILLSAVLVLAGGCAKEEEVVEPQSCPGASAGSVTTGSEGSAFVFKLDPMNSSQKSILSPSSVNLDSARVTASLSRLTGKGVLQGTRVDVRNGLTCAEDYGAFSATNKFEYSEKDTEFQEAMSYFYGDRYRQDLLEAGALEPRGESRTLKVVAHCMLADNAYYSSGGAGGEGEKVCLGDSVSTPGASYSDDASVVTHEIQHGTTGHTYSESVSLNQFWFDDAGSINEALSDFMSMMFTEPELYSALDPRTFGRWALGTFYPGYVGTRGAHQCPVYAQGFPDCTGFAAGAAGFSADDNRASFSYPDGLGWPYADNFSAKTLQAAFLEFSAQEEIHNSAQIIEGALWDAYVRLKNLNGGDLKSARHKMARVTMNAVASLPKPSAYSISPVNFIKFGHQVVANASASGFSSAEKDEVSLALEARGIFNPPTLSAGWATVGPGSGPVAGMKILDNPNTLKSWIMQFGGNPSSIPQGINTGLNGILNSGEVVTLWFDIGNLDAVTAGSVELSVTTSSPYLQFMPGPLNFGALSPNEAQIQYQKINGTEIVTALDSANGSKRVATGASYFQTNPFYSQSFKTALWVQVARGVPPGTVVQFDVEVRPANGPIQTLVFPTTVQ